ncbi:putative phosphorylated CTD-interacting factor 1-like [Trypanosoma theileri]|uniref:Putative phosphorylated CTD-interacting factor 1-like n=1 Tax=Trypanosoma theileri TaxID=67003 RepID=A0A1X0P0J4_9TRYP|nr:putative phosphorylated CTD-interacting factor 1-like [Trypanosoma theileri]ORC90328.1 putative phosphorylated CTD-interacting factor 1-like [Trypanosoma theileri]
MGSVEKCTCVEDPHNVGILTEVLRYQSACQLAQQLADLTAEELHSDRHESKGLMTAVIFEGLKAAAVATPPPPPSTINTNTNTKTISNSNTNSMGRNCTWEESTRTWVHPVLDVYRRARVYEAGSDNVTSVQTLEGVVLAKGCVLGVLRSESTNKEQGQEQEEEETKREVPLETLKLVEPISLYHDALLPAFECISAHRASRSAVHWFLEKLCGAPTKLLTSFNQKRRRAWALADRLTILFFEERRRLAKMKERLVRESAAGITLKYIKLVSAEEEEEEERDGMMMLKIHIQDNTEDKWFYNACMGQNKPTNLYDIHITLQIRTEHVERLRKLAACCVDEHFRMALALLLLRYAGLSGGKWEQESGWHAGVPSSVFDVLVSTFHVRAECFASPLNSTLPQYFSAFPDTDSFFGCCGNFFNSDEVLQLGESNPNEKTENKGILSLEANPPFDHEVIAAGLRRALEYLEKIPPTIPLSFVFILPDSTQANGIAVRQEAEESRFFRGGCVLSPQQSMYVHGARHIVRTADNRNGKSLNVHKRRRSPSPTNDEHLVALSCATRILVLQNDKAATMLPAEVGLNKVRSVWESLSSTRGVQ